MRQETGFLNERHCEYIFMRNIYVTLSFFHDFSRCKEQQYNSPVWTQCILVVAIEIIITSL